MRLTRGSPQARASFPRRKCNFRFWNIKLSSLYFDYVGAPLLASSALSIHGRLLNWTLFVPAGLDSSSLLPVFNSWHTALRTPALIAPYSLHASLGPEGFLPPAVSLGFLFNCLPFLLSCSFASFYVGV